MLVNKLSMTLASTLAAAVMLVAVSDPATAQKRKRKGKVKQVVSGDLDKGTLVQDWFGGERPWAEIDEVDYFWVKEGYDFSGKTLHFVEFPEPELLTDRDENDRRLAREMASDMHRSFADVWNSNFASQLPSSNDAGEIRVDGRIVDCSTGSTAAKMLVGFGAGSGNTTIDLKFIDAASGEVVAALHHRVVSGTSWSTTDSKFFKWVKKVGKEISSDGWHGAYQGGKGVRD